MHVREGRPGDAEAIYEVHHAAIEELGPTAYDDEQVDAWGQGGSPESYEIDSDSHQFVVAERDGTIVGFGCLDREPSERIESAVDVEVTAVYVHPDAVREGVGSALLAELERTAREWGCESLGLRSSLNAVPFYEARGYERVAEQTHEFSGGVEGQVVEMRTTL